MKRSISSLLMVALSSAGMLTSEAAYAAEGMPGDPALPSSAVASSAAANELPKDPRYWAFHEWYVNHSVLNVIVSGADLAHLEEVLGDLLRMKDRRVIIGDVLVVGGRFDPSKGASAPGLAALSKADAAALQRIRKLMLTNGLESPTLVEAESITRRLEVSHSPVWIVRHKGKNYVYEGLSSPSRLFTAQGVFHGR